MEGATTRIMKKNMDQQFKHYENKLEKRWMKKLDKELHIFMALFFIINILIIFTLFSTFKN